MSGDQRVQYKFMIPSALKARIEDAAHENRRSVSAEIVATLEEKYPAPTPGTSTNEMIAYVSEGKSDDEMRARADVMNTLLRERGRNLKIMVLDDVGARAVGAKVVVASGPPF